MVEFLDEKTVTTLSKMAREALYWYLRGETITESARRAGYAHPEKAGPRLRKSKKFQVAVDEHFNEQEMAASEVVARLSQQARAEYAKYIMADGAVNLAQMLDDGMAHLIKKIGYARDGQQVVEFYDAQSALVHVGRYHAIFTDRTDHTTDGEPINIIEVVRDGG